MKNTRSMMTKLAVAVVTMTCLLCVPQTLMAQKVEARHEEPEGSYCL